MLLTIAARALLAALLLAAGGIVPYLRGPVPLAKGADAAQAMGRYVSLDVDYIYDWYLGTGDSADSLTEKDYLIIQPDGTVLGFTAGSGAAMTAADGLLAECDAYYCDGTRAAPPDTVLHLTGVLKPMRGTQLAYYEQMVDEAGAGQSGTVLTLCLDTAAVTLWTDRTGMAVLTALAALLLVSCVCSAVRLARRRTPPVHAAPAPATGRAADAAASAQPSSLTPGFTSAAPARKSSGAPGKLPHAVPAAPAKPSSPTPGSASAAPAQKSSGTPGAPEPPGHSGPSNP